MRTDVNAVPHAGLRTQILKVQGNPKGPGGLQKEVGPNAQVEVETTGWRRPLTSADALALYKRKKGGHQLRLTMRPGAPSRYVFTTAWMGLRWPMPSKCPWAPCYEKLSKSRRIPMTPRVTHTRLPEGRHVTSILPGKEVGTCACKRDR